jgi:hypothetical protein
MTKLDTVHRTVSVFHTFSFPSTGVRISTRPETMGHCGPMGHLSPLGPDTSRQTSRSVGSHTLTSSIGT